MSTKHMHPARLAGLSRLPCRTVCRRLQSTLVRGRRGYTCAAMPAPRPIGDLVEGRPDFMRGGRSDEVDTNGGSFMQTFALRPSESRSPPNLAETTGGRDIDSEDASSLRTDRCKRLCRLRDVLKSPPRLSISNPIEGTAWKREAERHPIAVTVIALLSAALGCAAMLSPENGVSPACGCRWMSACCYL